MERDGTTLNTRRFLRVKYDAPCTVTYEDVAYEARVHNISTNGAMIGFSDSVMIPETESCLLDILPEPNQPPLRLKAEVVYSSYFTMGVKFTEVDDATRSRLDALVNDLMATAGSSALS